MVASAAPGKPSSRYSIEVADFEMGARSNLPDGNGIEQLALGGPA
jgi:hypothetical protein